VDQDAREDPSGAGEPRLVWLVDPTPGQVDRARADLGLDARLARELVAGSRRARLELHGDTVLAVLPTLRYLEDTSDIESGRLVVIATPHLVVVTGLGDPLAVRALRDRVHNDQALVGLRSHGVLVALVDAVVVSYQEIDDEVARDLTEIEQDVFGGGNRTASTTIYRLKREVQEFRRAAVPLRSPVQELVYLSGDSAGPSYPRELRLQVQGAAHRLEVVLQDLDSYDTLLSDVLSAHLSRVGVQQNEDMRKISAWAAMITVPTLIAGIYGMNFDHMPELHWLLGYPLALVLMSTAVLLLWRTFRRSGWL
jgi:magnesium transporter